MAARRATYAFAYLKPVGKVMRCEQCGARCTQIHETTVRRVRDLPLFEYRVVLHVPRRRVWCDRCGGPRLERLDWLGRYQKVTERFTRACEKLLQAASVQAVAEFYDLGWHTVKFGPGRSRETARAFFEQLPEGVAARIEAVAIDMTTAYELEIKAHCPQADVVSTCFMWWPNTDAKSLTGCGSVKPIQSIATRQTRTASTEIESLAPVAQPSQPQCAAIDPSERTACGQRGVDMRVLATR